jgi:4-hydroxythreonine-4-phosphate dehydrogenase
MMLSCPGLRVVPVTVHLRCGKQSTIFPARRLFMPAASPKRRYGAISAWPTKLVVAGLNPHAGEAGGRGREEIEIIEPAVAELRAVGIDVRGLSRPIRCFIPTRVPLLTPRSACITIRR